MSGILSRWFGSKPSPAEPEPRRDVAALLAPLRVPAVHLVTQAAPSRSYFGGEPRLPGDVAWPQNDGVRLPFLARLSLAEIHATAAVPWLPSSGALLFFYDTAQQPWGFDPDDRGKFAVLYVPDLPAPAAPTEAGGMRDAAAPNPRGIGMRRIEVLPSTDCDAVEALDLNDGEIDVFCELADTPFDDRPKHQVGGPPAPVQNDGMERECQLASHGINCGAESGYRHPRAAELRPGATHWRPADAGRQRRRARRDVGRRRHALLLGGRVGRARRRLRQRLGHPAVPLSEPATGREATCTRASVRSTLRRRASTR